MKLVLIIQSQDLNYVPVLFVRTAVTKPPSQLSSAVGEN